MSNIENINLTDAPREAIPKCPSCKMELSEIWVKSRGLGFIRRDEILMCPHCHVFLAYAISRRG